MKHFTNCKTLEELRREYKRLLKKYHPDNVGGSEELTKEINTEYEKIFEILKNQSSSQQKEDTFNKEMDAAFRDILNQIIDLDIDIEVIGSWIWVSGNTYSIKETLKRLGFNWIGKRKMWAWHQEPFTKKRNSSKSLDELRNYYGSEIVKEAQKKGTYKALAC